MKIFRLWWWRDVKFAVRESWQRHTRGFSGSEWYDFHSAASKWMLPRLKYFRQHKHGYPYGLSKWADEYNCTAEEEAADVKKWNEILDEIIWALEFYAEEPDWQTREEYMALYNRAQAGMKLFGEYFPALWD